MSGRIIKYGGTPTMEMFGQPCRTGRNHGGAGTLGMIDEHYLFEFENGWGASVIIGGVSFGSWELAVINPQGEIDYDHPVSQGDVVRGSEGEMVKWLREIKETPKDATFRDGKMIVDGEVVEEHKAIEP